MQTTNRRNNSLDLGNMVYGKVPPQSKDLEEAILGAIMLPNNGLRTYETVADILSWNCYYVEAHQRVFKAMGELNARRMPIDLLTVVEQLKTNEELEIVGGPYALSKLTNGVVSDANIEAHARIVMQKFLKRELIRIGGDIITAGYEDSIDVFDLMDSSEGQITGLRLGNLKQQYKSIQSIAQENIIKLEELRLRDESVTGVESGFPELDMVTCGWQDTDLVILAARPSVGKTAFALTMAKNAANSFLMKFNEEKASGKQTRQKSVAFFSLEMKDSQLVNRVLAQDSGVWLWRFKNGRIDDEQMRQIYNSTDKMNKVKIFVDDTPALKIMDFTSKARLLKRKENVGLIIVDYLQLMKVPEIKYREQEISAISQQLKATAKELQIPIIALSQLSREIEKNAPKTGKREPVLSDIRESGAIEQDADIVSFLFKPSDAEIIDDNSLKDIFYLKISKHRSGALAKFIGKFTGEDQKHHYLKVVDENTLNPLGKEWKPVTSLPAAPVKNYYETDQSDDAPF